MSDEIKGFLEIKQAFQGIKEVIDSIEKFEPKNPNDVCLQRFFVDYLIVLICREAEGSIKNIIYTISKIKNPKINESDLEKKLDKSFSNPKFEEIKNVFKEFTEKEIKEVVQIDEKIIQSLVEVVKYRNSIVHSNMYLDKQNYSKQLEDIKNKYKDIKELIDILCRNYEKFTK